MGCDNQNTKNNCTCTYASCSRHGNCCECVAYHRDMDELPGCFFSKEAERVYDRSVAFFIRSKTGE